MNSLVIYTCNSDICHRLLLTVPQMAVIAVSFIVCLIVCYLIISFEKLKNQASTPVLALSSPDHETETMRNLYTLEEYQAFLTWMMQMGIISFIEYDDLFAKGLPYLH